MSGVFTLFSCPKDDDEENTKSKNRYEVDSFDINLKCNEFKEEINQIRKRCMKALSFCSNLIGDLELAAKYNVQSKIQELLNELKASNHVLVMFTNPELQCCYQTTPNSSSSSFEPVNQANSSSKNLNTEHNQEQQPSFSFMIFVPQEFAKERTQIARLLFIISAKDDYETFKNVLDIKYSNCTTHGTKNQQTNALNRKSSNKHTNSLHTLASNNVRRMSSSNCFIYGNNNECETNNYLNKLSKMANMNRNSTPITSSNINESANNSFNLSPHVNSNGYLLYLQLPKNKNGKIISLEILISE